MGTTKKVFQLGAIVIAILFLLISIPKQASAGYFELSGTFSYSSSNYGAGQFQWSRHWSGSVGYHFLALSEIEFSIGDSVYRTKLDTVEDTTFHDQIYSVSWVQSFAPRDSFFQPYAKAGIGQLNRDASGYYSTGATPPAVYDSVTGILGVGVKILLFHSFALKGETSTYLTGGVISTWKDNVSASAGVSLYL